MKTESGLRAWQYRKPKASDISDKAIFAAIKHCQVNSVYSKEKIPAILSEVQNYLNMWPRKVVRAKLRSMIKRGFIDGCTHYGTDCRGDFTIITEVKYIDIPKAPEVASSF